jgi:hypothetical protein
MWKTWFDQQGDFNQISWIFLGDWSVFTLCIVILLSAGIMFLSWQNTQKMTNKARYILFALRSLIVVLCLFIFLQPAARLEDVTRVKNHIAILLDQSRSMQLPNSNQDQSQSRWQKLQNLIQQQTTTIEAWQKDHVVHFYGFDTHLKSIKRIGDIAKYQAQGEGTQLNTALEELSARIQSEDLSAIIIVSDGSDNSDSLPQVSPNIPPPIINIAQKLKVPIHTVCLGPKETIPDLSIAQVFADQFAFVRNAVSVDVAIKAYAYPRGIQRRVTLWRGSEELSQRILITQEGQIDYKIRFDFVPDQTGEEVYTIKIEAQEEESVTLNNSARFSMRVIRDKIRVLQVVGRPSWDQRFLRKHLKRNPNVELISFFILRTNASIESAHPDELSLIPFPTQELFEERLGSFDLMIFQNFTYQGYYMQQYLPLIREYVRQGGGFVMLGGDQSFSSGGYTGTAIADFLPIQLHPNGKKWVSLGDFKPTLSPVGIRHPITALHLIPEKNEDLWKNLPVLSGTNQVISARNDAQVLAWRPANPSQNRSAEPLIIASDFAKGRTLAITTDSLWHWAFSTAEDSSQNVKSPAKKRLNSYLAGAQSYHKFWGNVIRWLIRDPALNLMKVNSHKEHYAVQEQVRLTIRVLKSDYTAQEGVKVNVIIEDITAGENEVHQVFQGSVITQAQGEAYLNWKAAHEGAYRVRVQTQVEGADLVAQDLWVVAEDPLEFRNIAAQSHILKWYTQATQGQVLSPNDDWKNLKRKKAKIMKVNRRKDIALWSQTWMLFILILLPSLEWYLRRRWGLL